MTRRLKVYGGTVMRKTGQHRAIIAAHNAEEVAIALGNASAYYVRGYWSVTGNTKEIETATAKPGVLFLEIDRHSQNYMPDVL